MHIVDGALSNPVVIAGTAMAIGGIAMGLKQLTLERIPATGILSASFFVAALIHVPIGPSSVHLVLNGLAGLILGWAAFPALFVGLLLQTVFFGFGGVTVIGVNLLNIAAPAVLAWLLFGRLVERGTPMSGAIWAGVGGAFSIAATTICVAFSLALTGDEFIPAAKLVLLAHIPVMVIEALLTGAAVYLVRQVRPDLFTAVKGVAP
ncbi:cobalt transporter CbiM [Donghicola eburneus]|jgi:cobalt/nickel transport system permease protein|uniref:cobalt transporter CbiM n=1 Tax=Donghicola eburneus TaxID=393278 RepID=UPI0008E8A930|nr:cobalt transporter CbiM [Donghicola eburneus]SFQ57978.1 cobalt/nickel transport system permease protein [Donghicola eburneus]